MQNYEQLPQEDVDTIAVEMVDIHETSTVSTSFRSLQGGLRFIMVGLGIYVALYASICLIMWKTTIFGDNSRASLSVYLTISSDFAIAVAYFTIPGTLVYIVMKRKDLPFNWVFWLFAMFIICCGATHLIQMFNRHMTSYLLNTVVKCVTAFVSFLTSVVLVKLIPVALAVPSLESLEREIRERKLAQQKMIEAEKQREKTAKESERTKNLFFANMSHEIRTPLSGIIGLSDLLERSRKIPAEEREMVRQISSSGEILLAIVNDILDVAKLDERKIELEKIPFLPSEAVSAVESVLSMKAAEKGLPLLVEMDEEFQHLRLLGDPGRLKQAILNIVSNAVKFCSEGHVKIKCSFNKLQNNIVVVQIAVEDTGIGIPPDRMDRLFKTFTQGDSSTTRTFGGSGLGLYIAKQFMELLGGDITVSSTVGKGSTFVLKAPFPICTDPIVAESEPLEPSDFLAVNSKLILVVDDNEVNQKVAIKLLKYFGFENCECAPDGAKALNLMMAKKYDLVLMDCMMPIMDGYRATREMRKWESENNIPETTIVGLTANGLKEDEALCLKEGMNMYCRKPLTRKTLSDTLSKFFLDHN